MSCSELVCDHDAVDTRRYCRLQPPRRVFDDYRFSGTSAEALESFQKTASIRPRDPEVRFFLGMAHLSLGNREAAQREYETLQRLGAYQQAEVLKQQMNRQVPGDRPRD